MVMGVGFSLYMTGGVCELMRHALSGCATGNWAHLAALQRLQDGVYDQHAPS